jgi:hypothetical protein
MADAPKLNSATDATAAKYAPLSAMAVVSLALGGLYLFLLALFGYLAYQAKQPLLEWWLFALPAVGMFLAFIARRQIRTSEGARTGEGFANAGWWVCLISGACYLAYLVANDLAVRADSERAVVQWADKLAQANPADPADKPTWEAFERTLDPGSPQIGNPASAFAPVAAVQYGQFRDTPLLVLWSRNRQAAKFSPNGLRKWELSTDGKLTCEAAGTLSCPEGEFQVVVPMQRVSDAKKESRWQVVPVGGYKFLELETVSRTKYGWMVVGLEQSAMRTADQYFDLMHAGNPMFGTHPQLVLAGWTYGPSVADDRFVSGRRSAEYTERLTDPLALELRKALVGPTALIIGPTDPSAATPGFFTRSDGQPHTDAPYVRPDGQKVERALSSLRRVWELPGTSLILPGYRSRLRNPDMAQRNPLLDTSDPARVLVKVPVDFAPRREEFTGKTFSSGRLVLVCDDPAAVKEVNAAREDAIAGRDRPKLDPPTELRSFPFRVLRFETDLLPVSPPEMTQQSAPGGMGG